MSAINFPDTPTNNQEFTSGGRTWKWIAADGVWDVVSIPNVISSPSSTVVPLTVKGSEAQTANIFDVSNFSNTLLLSVLANGRIRIPAGGVLESPLVQNPQTGTSYTLALLDAGRLVELSNTSTVTITVPLESTVAFPIGTQIQMLQTNTGQVVVAGAVGVTVNATPGTRFRTQWSSATLIKRAANTWVLIGDLVP
jgi:hypothetical protein